MNCIDCGSKTKKNGKDGNGYQRLMCKSCGKTFTDKPKLQGSNLPADKVLLIVNLLVEGNSVRSTERITGVHRDTILSVLELVGKRCMEIEKKHIRNLNVGHIQADEIWAFVGMKQKTKNRKEIKSSRLGDAYTFVAIDQHSKLIAAWHLGKRTEQDTLVFLEKLYAVTKDSDRYQMSTDAFKGYDHTVNEVLGTITDYAQLIKLYGVPNPKETRYSPAECIGIKKRAVHGDPDMDKVCTSHIERQNLTMRMSMRRLTRLTNGFSKKWENLRYALALQFAYYNFCRIHKTLRCTPAMEAGITKTVWELKDILGFSL
ncbi:MAG TPA: IS1 family transposase [Aridibacter sp.]|nr:IS1 family transposase [Aridibacter sp.]